GLGTNFGSVNVGSTANGVAAFMLSSTGTGPLAVNSIALSGPSDFVLSTDCPMNGDPLPAGSYCMVIVSFTPTAAGTRTAGIAFSYNAPGGNQTFQLQGTGVVHPTTLTVSSAPADLVNTQPVTTTYAGEFYVAHVTAGHVTIQVDQRTPASDPQFIDYAQTPVWVRVTLVGAAASSDFWVQVTDASNWSTTGLGVATAPLPAL